MTAVSISASRGSNYDKSASYTIGTSAPATGDFELRYNLLDAQSVAILKKDLILFLDRLECGLNSGKGFFSTSVNGTNFVGPQL